MNRFSILYLFIFLISFKSFSQEGQIIELDPVEIIPTDKILVVSNFPKKHRDSFVQVQGKTSIVSGFVNNQNSAIQLEGLEFFFNYDWAQDSGGFFVQPVLTNEENGLPGSALVSFKEKYLITSKLGNRLYIDLSSKNISLDVNDKVFIGIKFLENVISGVHNEFNITFFQGKTTETTFLLYPGELRSQEVVGPGKHSAGLKYSVVYKLKE